MAASSDDEKTAPSEDQLLAPGPIDFVTLGMFIIGVITSPISHAPNGLDLTNIAKMKSNSLRLPRQSGTFSVAPEPTQP